MFITNINNTSLWHFAKTLLKCPESHKGRVLWHCLIMVMYIPQIDIYRCRDPQVDTCFHQGWAHRPLSL